MVAVGDVVLDALLVCAGCAVGVTMSKPNNINLPSAHVAGTISSYMMLMSYHLLWFKISPSYLAAASTYDDSMVIIIRFEFELHHHCVFIGDWLINHYEVPEVMPGYAIMTWGSI